MYATAWSVNNSDHLAKKSRMVYTELSSMVVKYCIDLKDLCPRKML